MSHDEITVDHVGTAGALTSYGDAHSQALGQLAEPGSTAGLPGEHLAAVAALLGRGRALHSAGESWAEAGEGANRSLADTDEVNAGRFEGELR